MNFSSLSPAAQEALLDGPALAPPSGVVPQLNNPSNLHGTSNAIQIVCLSVATLALCMRMYAKIRLIRDVVSADYAILLGWVRRGANVARCGFCSLLQVVFVGYSVPCWLVTSIAAAVHQWNVRLRYLGLFIEYVRIGSAIYGVSVFFIKLSILLQYLQLFTPMRKTDSMWWSCYSLIAVNFVFYVVNFFIWLLACHPPSRAWGPLITDGPCRNLDFVVIVANSINMLSNFTILVLPQVIIWRLHMSKRRQLGISLIFLFGILACASSAARFAYTIKLYTSADKTYYTWYADIWTYPEMSSGIIAACLPASIRFVREVISCQPFMSIKSAWRAFVKPSEDESRPSFTIQFGEIRCLPSATAKVRSLRKFTRTGVTECCQNASDADLRNVEAGRGGIHVMHSVSVQVSATEDASEV